jgi:RNA polymerase-binding protein DksA
MAEENLKMIRAALEEERTTVEKQLEEAGVDPAGDEVAVSVDEGFADSAQATTERGESIALVEQFRSHRSEVLAALQRVDDGTYGRCESCGESIPWERLEALPTARQCVACKQQG